MAEATEPTPPGPGGESRSVPAGPPAGAPPPPREGITTHLAPMPPDTEARERYQPISLLALAGFLLGIFYALIVGAGGALAFSTRSAWLLPAWTLILPALGAGLSWMARVRIRGSE